MSDNTPQNSPDVPPAPPVPPMPPYAGDAPPAYTPPADPYGSAPTAPGYPAPSAYPPPPGPGSYPAPSGYGTPAPYPYAPGPRTNGLAITSLISAIAAFVILPFIASIVAVVTGHIALRQLRTSGENGRGMALAGTIVGWVGVGIGLLFIGLIVVWLVAAASMAGSAYTITS